MFLKNDGDEQNTKVAYLAERVNSLKAEREEKIAEIPTRPDPAELNEALKRAEKHQRSVGMYLGKIRKCS